MGEREDLLTSIRSRVAHAASTGEGTAVLDPAALDESRSLGKICDAGDGNDLEARYAMGWLHHYRARFGTRPQQREAEQNLAVHWLTPCFVAGRVPLPEPLLTSLAERAVPSALTVQRRAQITGDPEDQAQSVRLCRRIVHSLPEDHPARAALLSNLGIALLMRATYTTAVTGLDEAVETVRAAVRAVSDQDPERPVYLTNLGLALRARFERSGAPADIDEAVEMLRAAVRATSDGDAERASRMYHLSLALGVRFERTAALPDLDEEVELIRTVVRTAPAGHPDQVKYRSVLGGVLKARFERTGAMEDLEEAVRLTRAAVRDAPGDRHDRAQGLSALSFVLLTRFEHSGEANDLDEAVESARAAVRVAPDQYPDVDRAILLFGLGGALLRRFGLTAAPADLDEAVEALRGALRIVPEDYPLRAAYEAVLGDALGKRSERDGSAQRDGQEQLSLWRRTVEERTAPPRLRIMTAREAARWAAPSDPALAAGLLAQAVLMLPELAPRRLHRGDQQFVLGSVSAGLAAEAASTALDDPTVDVRERPARALRLAEAGRAVLLSQALETRSDLTDLYDEHPGLAERFCELRDLLDQGQAEAAAPGAAGRTAATGRERHHLAQELEAVLARIRACEGFTAFGLPPTLDDLLAEAAHGPVVTFNVSRYRSDALLLTRDGVTSCPLPRLTEEAVIGQVNTFYRALAGTMASDGDRISAQQSLCRVLEWLWEAAVEPVLSALGDALPAAGPDQDGKPLPRLWWAPGGILGLLPLHAAGFHAAPGQGPQRRTVLDRVISSYTPTVRALRHARRPRPRTADGLRSLIVAMPTTPGLGRLRYVQEEAGRLRSLLPRPVLLTAPGSDPEETAPGPAGSGVPTLAAVLDRLPECAIAHFACHGAGDRTDPSLSRLFLQDHATAPLTVAALARVDLGRARLAFLSACSTADPGRADLLDEAIHLASAFQLAGFPHVVGTLWPIDDHLAVTVAESFYTHLTTGPPGTLDPDRSAAALHHAVRTVRDRYPRTPSLWAAHLHTGA
ncbi:CHAT domain-containing tetratricopeptide repeat protein [Streptomyces nojiriensis]|uniref:CHAT domain-containing tetratricopeptide repeat protein n=1 Tax=Streptomyces nojiriensis TaxID=66374 RepID=UPI0035D83458